MPLSQLEEHLWDAQDWFRDRCYGTEKIVVALRKKLISLDPSLPQYYDGTAWAKIESEWTEAA
jgi:hypothetical protein